MRYVLHIGRNKTGTSALQNFLFRNRKKLKEFGVVYPEFGLEERNAHGLARTHHKLARDIKNQEIDGLRDALYSEVAGYDDVVLSSEIFHTIADPSRVARVFEPGTTKVVIYLREYVTYLASWYQQSIHSTNSTMRFSDVIGNFDASNVPLVDRWVDVFGKENVIVRLYDRDRLIENDIVPDFFSAAGLGHINLASLDRTEERHINPSLSGNLLFFKRVLNEFIDNDESALIAPEVTALTQLERSFTGKIEVSEELVNRINFHYRFDRHELLKKYGLLIPKRESSIDGMECPSVGRLHDDWEKIVNYSINNDFKLSRFIKRIPHITNDSLHSGS